VSPNIEQAKSGEQIKIMQDQEGKGTVEKKEQPHDQKVAVPVQSAAQKVDTNQQ